VIISLVLLNLLLFSGCPEIDPAETAAPDEIVPASRARDQLTTAPGSSRPHPSHFWMNEVSPAAWPSIEVPASA